MRTARREFLKSVGAFGATAVIQLFAGDITSVFATAINGETRVIWFQGAADSGCSISLIQGMHPDLIDIITDFKMTIDFHPNVMIPEGDAAVQVLRDAASGNRPVDVLVVEGAVPEGIFGTVGEIDSKPVPMDTWIRQLASRAKYVVAVGTCATSGGIPGAFPNPTHAKGLQFYKFEKGGALGADFKSGAGLPVINIPGCPPHPDWITLTLADVLQGFVPTLDDYQRPTAFFGRTVHDQCPRLGYYEKGEFAAKFGDLQCLWKLGCKGPITYADCPAIKWNRSINSCTIFGSGCRACVDPSFPDPPSSPFFKEVQAIPTPLGIDVNLAGQMIGAATAIGIGAHAVRKFGLKGRPKAPAETAEEGT